MIHERDAEIKVRVLTIFINSQTGIAYSSFYGMNINLRLSDNLVY